MRELSLFTGAGGGIYGSKLLGWKTVGYVEWEEYPQKVIAQRIKDGIFDEAPIFTDVREFVQSGAARQYRGFVDVVTGGFPCQPFSVAGKRKASDDDRNMWPATMDVIKAVKPPVVFLENVPGLLSATVDDESGRSIHYFGEVLRDLAESGYDAKWCVLGADNVGAPHHRKRLWILAHTTRKLFYGARSQRQENRRSKYSNGGCNVANTKHNGLESHKPKGRNRIQFKNRKKVSEVRSWEKTLIPYPKFKRLQRSAEPTYMLKKKLAKLSRAELARGFEFNPPGSSWWNFEPLLGRVANGVANRSHRLKAIGNGQVSLTMACAYEILSKEFLR